MPYNSIFEAGGLFRDIVLTEKVKENFRDSLN